MPTITKKELRQTIKDILNVRESLTFGYVPPNVPNYERAEDDCVNVNAITDHDLEQEIKNLPDKKDCHDDDEYLYIENAIRLEIRKLLKDL